MANKPRPCTSNGFKPTIDKCVAIGTPPAKVANFIKDIMGHNRKLNDERKQCQVPGPIFPIPITRSLSVREKPVTSYKFSITEMVEAKNPNKEKPICPFKNNPALENDCVKSEGGTPGFSCNDISIIPGSTDNRFYDGSFVTERKVRRAATFKQPISSTPVSEGPTASSCTSGKTTLPLPRTPPINHLKSSISALRLKYQGISPVEEFTSRQQCSQNVAPLIAALKEQIRQKIQTFPTIAYQQRQGPNYNPTWSWLGVFKTLESQMSKEPCEMECYRMIRGFSSQVKNCASILEQIRHDFVAGLPEYEPGKGVDRVCQEMAVCSVGTRGRNSISVGQVPYLKSIFQGELDKQQKYGVWMSKNLSDPKDARKRNDLAAWIIKNGKILKYSTETVHMAVYYADAYLTIKGNKIVNCAWGLLGISVLNIAGKLEETAPAPVARILRLSGQFYKMDEIKWMERDILRKLKFDVYPPLAPLFASMVLLGGSLDIPTVNLRKLIMDLTLGILHQSLKDHRLFSIPPADKAKAALEIAVEFIFYQYSIFSKRDTSAFPCNTIDPGKALGEFVVNLCTETFTQRFVSKKIPGVIPAVTCHASPVRDIKA